MTSMKLILLFGLLAMLLVVLVPDRLIADESVMQPNAFCPVMTDEPIDPSIHVDHEGRRVYMCCNMCRRSFQADPEKYLSNLPEGYFAAVLSAPDESGTGHDEPDSSESIAAPVHDHENDHAISESLIQQFVEFAGRFHPIAVHFPIALILAALLAEILGMWMGAAQMHATARYCALLAAASGLAAGLLGWAAAAGASYPTLEGTLEWHRWLGTTSAVLIVATAIAGEVAARRSKTSWRWLFRGLLILAAVLTGIVGHLGATLIYGPDHFGF